MEDYPEHVLEVGSYNTICKMCGKKRKKDGNSFCQSCTDFKNFGTRFQEIKQSERERAAKKVLIEEREKALFELQQKIKADKEELQTIEKILLLQQQSIKMQSDLVSDNIRRYRTLSGPLSLLETHCTIVRPTNSQEDVYFGHVTLIIKTLKGIENRLHYGIKMFDNLPEKLDHEFWAPSDNPNNISHNDLIEDFGDFHFPPTTSLSDIMTRHFIKCWEIFDKEQWPNQIWKEDDTIKDERAPKLLKRLKKQEYDRSTLDSSYIERELKRTTKKDDLCFQSFQAIPVIEEEPKRRLKDPKIRQQEATEDEPKRGLKDKLLTPLVTEDALQKSKIRLKDAKITQQDAIRKKAALEKAEAERLARAEQSARDTENAAAAKVLKENAALEKAEAERLARAEQSARDAENAAAAKPYISDVATQKGPEDLEKYLDELILANKIITELSEKVSKLNNKLTKLCKMDFKTDHADHAKELKSTLEAEYTKCLEEVDENIEIIDDFHLLQREDKKHKHDVLSQLQEKLNTGIGVLNLLETNGIYRVDVPISEIKDVSVGNNKKRKENLKIKSLDNMIAELKKEVDKFLEEEKLISLTTNDEVKSSIYILNNLEKKSNEIRDSIKEDTIISSKKKAEMLGILSSIINTIDAKKKIYSDIKILIDEIIVLNKSEKSLTSMSGDKKNDERFNLLTGYRIWMHKCDKVISKNDVESINTDLQNLLISKHEILKDLLRDFYRNNKIKNEDSRVIIENLRMIDPTYTFTRDKLSKLVDGLRTEKGGELTTNDILTLIDTYKEEADQTPDTPDIEPDNLINMQLAIYAHNNILIEVERKVHTGFRKTLFLLDIDRNSEEFKNVTSKLIEEQTDYLEKINENIQSLKTFPNLPVTAKKEAHDTLVRWKYALTKRIQYLEKLVDAQEGEDVPNQTQDALNSFYTILKDLREEVYKNMNENLDDIELLTDDVDKIIISLIVKLENSVEKINANIKLLKENKIIPTSDVTGMYAFFFTFATRLKSILSLFIDIDIPEMKKQISEIMFEEKTDYSKQRRLLINSYRIWIRRYNNSIERTLETRIEKNDKKCITAILVKAKESKETLLENLLQMEDDYIRELYRDTEIVNEDDNVIIENLLMLKGHDHKTRMDASIYVNRIRRIYTGLGKTLSTKDILSRIDEKLIHKPQKA